MLPGSEVALLCGNDPAEVADWMFNARMHRRHWKHEDCDFAEYMESFEGEDSDGGRRVVNAGDEFPRGFSVKEVRFIPDTIDAVMLFASALKTRCGYLLSETTFRGIGAISDLEDVVRLALMESGGRTLTADSDVIGRLLMELDQWTTARRAEVAAAKGLQGIADNVYIEPCKNWKVATERMENLADAGEKFISEPHTAARIGAKSRGPVRTALEKSHRLRLWAWGDKKPDTETLTDHHKRNDSGCIDVPDDAVLEIDTVDKVIERMPESQQRELEREPCLSRHEAAVEFIQEKLPAIVKHYDLKEDELRGKGYDYAAELVITMLDKRDTGQINFR